MGSWNRRTCMWTCNLSCHMYHPLPSVEYVVASPPLMLLHVKKYILDAPTAKHHLLLLRRCSWALLDWPQMWSSSVSFRGFLNHWNRLAIDKQVLKNTLSVLIEIGTSHIWHSAFTAMSVQKENFICNIFLKDKHGQLIPLPNFLKNKQYFPWKQTLRFSKL